MKYNYTEIFKNKTDKELYTIYLGESYLGSDATEFAKIELERRNFHFGNIEKHKKKWELENLIVEEKQEKGNFLRPFSSWLHYRIMSIVGFFFAFFAIVDIVRNYLGEDHYRGIFGNIPFILVGTYFAIYGFVVSKQKRKREKFRTNRVKELINEL